MIRDDDGDLVRSKIEWLPRNLRFATANSFVVLLLLFLMLFAGREDVVEHIHQTGMTRASLTVTLQSHEEAHGPILRRISVRCTAVFSRFPYLGSPKRMDLRPVAPILSS